MKDSKKMSNKVIFSLQNKFVDCNLDDTYEREGKRTTSKIMSK